MKNKIKCNMITITNNDYSFKKTIPIDIISISETMMNIIQQKHFKYI